MATPIEQLDGVERRIEGFIDPSLIQSVPVLRACLRQVHEDAEFLFKTLQQRTDALRYAVDIVARIATERGMDECGAEDCTLDTPRCAVRIAQSEMRGRLGLWRG